MSRIWWLTVAATCYVVAFWFPDVCFWLILGYPIGIIIAGASYGIPWYVAYLWGLITYTCHSFGLFYGMVDMASGNFLLRLIPPFFMLCYFALFPALVFGIATRIQHHVISLFGRIILWIVALTVVTLLLDHIAMIISGAWEGYPMLHPIIPLASFPQLLSLSALIGKTGYTLILFITAGLVAYAILSPERHHLMWALLAAIPWLTSYYLAHTDAAPQEMKKVTAIPMMFPFGIDINTIQNTMNETMQLAYQAYPETEVFVLPESAFHCCDMESYVANWNMPKPYQRLLYGAYVCHDDNNVYGAACLVARNHVIQKYYKQHTLPLAERIPSLIDFSWIREQHCSQEPELTPSSENRHPMPITKEMQGLPYICSELFMSQQQSAYPDTPIIFLGHDMWLNHKPSHYVSVMLLYLARMNAVRWQQPIYYVSYLHTRYISPHGTMYELQSFT